MYRSAKKLEIEIYNTKLALLDAKCQLLVSKANLEGYQQQLVEATQAIYTKDTSPVYRFFWIKSKSLAQLALELQDSLKALIFDTESKINDQHFFIRRLEARIDHLSKYKSIQDAASKNCKRPSDLQVIPEQRPTTRNLQSAV